VNLTTRRESETETGNPLANSEPESEEPLKKRGEREQAAEKLKRRSGEFDHRHIPWGVLSL
jgi:hypothetical protein